MKGCIRTWKYNIQNSDAMCEGPCRQIMMNGICRHVMSINVQINSVECTMLQMTK
jgi:hypothetical protein